MKAFLITMLYFLSLTSVEEHDAAIAVFNISQDKKGIVLTIVFDIEDYYTVNQLTKSEVTKSHFRDYLKSTTTWKINGKSTLINVTNLKADHEHFRAECRLDYSTRMVESIAIYNEFFSNVAGHSNIIMIDLNDTFRDFRMHTGRRDLEVSF